MEVQGELTTEEHAVATERRLSFEQAVTATTVLDVQLSPDGEQVAYVTSSASREGAHPTSQIWLVSANGGRSRRLTASSGANGTPQWSPDGKYIVFLSDRAQRGTLQVYFLDLSGGEALQLTNCEGGVSQVVWSPDGSMLACVVGDVESAEARRRRERGDDVRVVDRGAKRASLYLLAVPEKPAERPLDTYPEMRRVSPEGMHVAAQAASLPGSGLSWAPDGEWVVVAVAASSKPHDVWFPQLVYISVDGEIKRLGNFEGLLPSVKFSPDGDTIAFVAAEGRIPALYSLQTIPASGGIPHIVSPGYNGSCYAFEWLPSGDQLAVTMEIGEEHVIQLVDLETGTLRNAFEPFERPGTGAQLLSVSADGNRIAFVRSDDYSFEDVWIAERDKSPRQLTDLNPWVRGVDFGETRDLRWRASDGLELQGLLILPTGYEGGKRYPLLVQIHGGPQVAWTHRLYAGWKDWGQFMAQRGFAVFLPNPRGSSGRGTAFLSAIVGCYGEPDWADIMAGVDHVIDLGIADPERLVVGGWSGGGFLTNWTITHTSRFKAAVSGAGIANWVSFQGTTDIRGVFDRYLGPVDEQPETHWRLSPIRSINQAVTPTLILYGEADPRVPVSQGYELYAGLKSRGVETQLVTYPRGEHLIHERAHQIDLLRRVVDWFESHISA